MAISNFYENAKDALDELKRSREFKKANKEREKSKELLAALMKCRGRLETSKTDFNRVIKTQSRNIKKGRAEGMDVLLEEQILWDAAIGYMLVRDAIYSLESINTYDSVDHAYEMLNEAVKVMTGKGKPSNKLFLGAQRKRKDYEFLNSSAALKEKEQLLDTFFAELEVTGDIEACLEAARDPDALRADSFRAYSDTRSGRGSADEILARIPEDEDEDVPEPGSEQYKKRYDSSVPRMVKEDETDAET